MPSKTQLAERISTFLLLAVMASWSWQSCGGVARAADIKGINIGLNPLKMLAPESEPLEQFEQDNHKRIAIADAAGFKLVRLRFRIANVRQEAPADRRDLTLRAMAYFVREANANGMKVLVALVAENGHDAQDLVCHLQDNLTQTALTVAKALPDTPQAGIEPFNEPPDGCGPPNGNARWVNLAQSIYHELRQVRPHITIVTSGGGWGLLKLDPTPYRADSNVIFSFHYYEPFLFTGQGQAGLYPGSNINVQHFPWPYDPQAVQQAEAQALQMLATDRTIGDDKRAGILTGLKAEYNKYADTGRVDYATSRFNAVKSWAAAHGIANERIFVGEFGVLRPTRSSTGSPDPNAAKWMHVVAQTARQDHFLWAVFDLDTAYSVVCGSSPSEKICDAYRAALQ